MNLNQMTTPQATTKLFHGEDASSEEVELRRNPRRHRISDDGDMPMPMVPSGMLPPRFMKIVQNDRRQRVELHLRGQFDDPILNTHEITELYELSEKYPMLFIYINSVGGRVDLFLELLNITKRFRHVCTIASGQVASAGFMMWCSGHVRVVQDHTELMAHRESYMSAGKTDQHVDLSQHNAKRFDRLLRDVASDVLTEKEMETARYTEVWLTDLQVLERGAAVTWEKFLEAERTTVEVYNVMALNGETFIVTATGDCCPCDIQADVNQTISPFDLIYQGNEEESEEATQATEEEDGSDSEELVMDATDLEVEDEQTVQRVEVLQSFYGNDLAEAEAAFGGTIVVPTDTEAFLTSIGDMGCFNELKAIIVADEMNEPNKVRYQVKRVLRLFGINESHQMIRSNGDVIIFIGSRDVGVIIGNFKLSVMY